MPVATNCCAVPGAIVIFAGITEIETSAGDMEMASEPFTDPEDAVTETCPLAFAVRRPPADTVATPGFEVLQLTLAVRSCVLPLLYLPKAVICSVCPAISP